MNEASIKHLRKQLHTINTIIRKLEGVLEQARTMNTQYTNKSNLGWLLSMFVGEVGTLLAVSSDNKAQKWHHVVHKLEEKLFLLTIDKKLKEKEIEYALKKS